jgi:PAS domain S-box-containing protein
LDTEPTERETRAREAQAFAESIVDTVREPLLVLDQSLRVITANRSFRHTFRVSPEETQGTLIYELGNGQWDIPELRRLLEEILPGHTHFDDFEVRHGFPDIGHKVMLLNARKLYRPANNTTMLLLAIEDITERRRAEEAVRVSEEAAWSARELLSTTLRSIGDAVIATDTAGRITFLNPVAEALTGWTAAEAIGRDHTEVFRIVSEETRQPAESPVAKVLRDGVIAGLANHTALIRKDGTEVPIDDSGAPIRDADGNLFGVVLVFRDITERRAEEARLQAAFERERRIAEALQRPLTLEVPEDAFAGLAVATLYEAAWNEAQVGGDFFDAFAMPQGRVAVAIADASGKGLSAAVRTIQLKEVLRAFTREYPHSPAAIVARLNDFVCDTRLFDDSDDTREAFSCLTLAILDTETGEGSLVTAGGEPALLVRAGGAAAEEVEVSGLPLGIQRRELYTVWPFRLLPGDTLVLVTDGITEARRGHGHGQDAEFLGYEGMTALATAALGQGLPSLRDTARVILDGARAFGGALRDDACVVLVRRHPTA